MNTHEGTSNQRNQHEPGRVIALYGAAGGQGTTVCTTALGARLAEAGHRVLIVDYRGDVAASVGLAADPDAPSDLDLDTPESLFGATSPVTRRLSLLAYPQCFLAMDDPTECKAQTRVRSALRSATAMFDFVVVDAGSFGSLEALYVASALGVAADERILVCRGSYTALRRAVHDPVLDTITGLVVVETAGRPLRSREVADVLQRPVLDVVQDDPNVARAHDAGVLASRVPAGLLERLPEYLLDGSAPKGVSA